MKAEKYKGLNDYISNLATENEAQVGRTIILPSTHPQSPRFLTQLYQDSMTICITFGKPDLFITFTCNPNRPEIIESCAGYSPSDRPDIIK
ncbi:MAG: putative ATP-dependent DNA helicase PIF1 [Streblomastix strix]|uniref:Putative ATP-dependent DNA helicase PIF1 n=1 Tax=Streblomastix strix TaxID=222440 RepID=A0A5J4UIV8_9EUKA|nr:MAG: putative ATP-dependent DNA helicase PIF1 [Streblomastix strix]